ncbi:hypothetical protein PR048_028354 [Dryococelus australis]|uniref:Ionotropic receptor n=1 Tax=Dryococelus australis TaxID=614101 RepID=A0ABQ9GJ34_9NEOP|nr:hypothetical protein PR048_028354 [Dryococelus australis]
MYVAYFNRYLLVFIYLRGFEELTLHEEVRNQFQGTHNVSVFLEDPHFQNIFEDIFGDFGEINVIFMTRGLNSSSAETNVVKQVAKGSNSSISVWKMNAQVNFSKQCLNATSIKLLENTSKHEAYVFLVDDYADLMDSLYRKRCVNVLWKVEATYLIIFKQTSYLDNKKNWRPTMKKIMHILWNDYAVLKVFASRFNSYGRLESGVSTYNPFFRTKQGMMGKMCSWKASDLKPLNCGSFPNKLQDMYGYPMIVDLFSVKITAQHDGTGNSSNVTSHSFYGRDAMMLQSLEKVMNFTAVIRHLQGDEMLGFETNDTANGTLGDIVNSRADVAMNGRFVQVFENRALKFLSLGVDMQHVCVVVPKSSDIPPYLIFIKCLSFKVWSGFALSYTASFITLSLLRNVLGYRACTLKTLMDTLIIFMSIPLVCFTKFSHVSQRALLSSLALFSIVIMNTFQCSLIEVVTKHGVYPEIDTLQHLDESNLPIAANHETLSTFENTLNPLMDRLHTKVFLANESVVGRAVVDRNVAFLSTKKLASSYLEVYPALQTALHIVSESPRTYFISYVVPRTSPYASEFHRHILFIRESGIFNKWVNEGYNKHFLTYKQEFSGDVRRFKPLVWSDLKFAFAFWLFSVVLCSIVFLLEYSHTMRYGTTLLLFFV